MRGTGLGRDEVEVGCASKYSACPLSVDDDAV
jgi:hypothetical protein